MFLRGVILIAISSTACGPRPAVRGAALPSQIGAWIPGDAAMVIAVGEPEPGEAEAIDAIAAALELPRPGSFLELPPDLLAAWHAAGVVARGAAWIDLEREEGGPMARCATVSDTAKATAALIGVGGAGGVTSTAGTASVIALGEATVVVRDGVACVITRGAPSRREHHAVRLATLGDDERLAPAALAPAAGAAYVAWGPGTVLGAGIHDDLSAALGDAERAVGVDHDAATQALRIRIDAPDATIAIGQYASSRPVAIPTIPLPTLAADGNTDVPLSPEYEQALAPVQASIAEATAHAAAIARIDEQARAAWRDAWGTATLTAGTMTWRLPAPAPELRVNANAAYQRANAGIEAEIAGYQAAVQAVEAAQPALIKLRARDVAAWDRAHH